MGVWVAVMWHSDFQSANVVMNVRSHDRRVLIEDDGIACFGAIVVDLDALKRGVLTDNIPRNTRVYEGPGCSVFVASNGWQSSPRLSAFVDPDI